MVKLLKNFGGPIYRPIRFAYRLSTAAWRGMPNFIVIGAQKAGTSSLFFYLSQHPEIQASLYKEIHYYNYHHKHGKGLNWYKSFFPLKSTLKGKLTGEASPYYLFDEGAAKTLKNDLPNVKLIVLLRNPIDRAYSGYQMNRRNSTTDEFPSFEEAINNLNLQEKANISYLLWGHYAQHIKNWLKYFDREQFLFIKSERFFSDPHNTLKQCYDFLDLKTVYPDNLSPQVVGTYNEISPELRTQLDDYFKDHNQQLIELLGEKFSWQNSPSSDLA